MSNHLRTKLYNRTNKFFDPIKVRDQDLASYLRIERSDLSNGLDPVSTPLVRQIISIYASDHSVFEPQSSYTLRHITRFIGVKRERLTTVRIAKLTRTCTYIASYHKGSSTTTPALPLIGAASARADRIHTVML